MSWEDLEKKTPLAPPDDDWARLHLAAFGTGPGAELLARYHRKIVDSVPAATAPESVLRDHEGQRRLIVYMEQMIERGHALARAKTSK